MNAASLLLPTPLPISGLVAVPDVFTPAVPLEGYPPTPAWLGFDPYRGKATTLTVAMTKRSGPAL